MSSEFQDWVAPFIVDPKAPEITVDVMLPMGTYQSPKDSVFVPVDLGDWMKLCSLAAVPAVPALRVGSVPVYDLARFDTEDGNTEAMRKFWGDIAIIKKHYPMGYMLRWSSCSCDAVKSRLGSGEVDWHPDLMDLAIDDMRAYDLVTDFPRTTISAWLRPWIQFLLEDAYPIEYRVFVWDDRIIGISNYYPQRPLPDDNATKADIDQIIGMTERMIEVQKKPMLIPQLQALTKDALPRGNCWTADFGRLPDGAMLFLEGGPPHTSIWGAHPCCFESGAIAGIALRDLTLGGKDW